MASLRSATLLLTSFIARAAGQAILFWAFARIGGAASAGQFAIGFAVSTPVFMLADLGLRNVLQTLRAPPSFSVFLVLRVATSLVASAALVVAVTSGLIDVSLPVVLGLVGLKFADSIIDICHGDLQARNEIGTVALTNWVNALASCLVAVLAVYVVGSAVLALLGSLVVSAVVAVWLLTGIGRVKAFDYSAFRFSEPHRRLLRVGAQVGMAQCLVACLVYLPVLFLTLGGTESDVGVLAAALYAITFANLFYSALMQTWLSPLRACVDRAEASAAKTLWWRFVMIMSGVGLVASVSVTFLLPAMLQVVFGQEFLITTRAAFIIGMTLMALAWEYTANILLLVSNRYGSPLGGSLVALLVAVGVALLLLPHASVTTAAALGLVGVTSRAVFATAVASIRSRAGRGWILHAAR